MLELHCLNYSYSVIIEVKGLNGNATMYGPIEARFPFPSDLL
jgi:hypothetical protein